MFTIKIVNDAEDNITLFSWSNVRSYGPMSTQFEIFKKDEIDRADDEIKEMCQYYYAYICDGGGNEYWLSIGDDCFITDASGKTVLIHRPPQPIGGPDGWVES